MVVELQRERPCAKLHETLREELERVTSDTKARLLGLRKLEADHAERLETASDEVQR